MKKLVIVLFVILGVAVKLSAQIKNYNNFEKEVVLTKSKLILLHKMEKQADTVIDIEKIHIENSCGFKRTDTVRIYPIDSDAKNDINYSLACLLIERSLNIDENTRMPIDPSVDIPDSLLPRWTHLFGEDVYLKRKLQIKCDTIKKVYDGTKPGPAASESDFFSFLTLAGLWFFFTLLQMFHSKSKKFTLWGSIVLFLMIFLLGILGLFDLQGHSKSFFDICFLPVVVTLPSFLTLLIPVKKKEGILEKHILKC